MADQGEQQNTSMVCGTAYPEQPGKPDCVYYVRHGMCGYGNRCRFNHPPASRILFPDQAGSKVHFPERIGQPDCQYYLRTGDCKYGADCKYHHPWKRGGSPKEEVRLNLSGLPMRLGEKECIHYARTGACKFGFNCKFHHPQPGVNGSAVTPMSNSPVYTMGTYYQPSLDPLPLPAMVARGSYLPGLRIPTPTSYTPIILSPQWGFKGPISPVTPLDGIDQSPKASNDTIQRNVSAGIYAKTSKPPPIPEDDFPEREGQPECQYYLKTGDCRFGAACKFHHPKDWAPTASPSSCMLSIVGLPLRPGEPQCSFYVRYGICKFGPVCKFDHPILVPYYNALASRPVINMAMGVRIGMPESMANNSCAGGLKRSDRRATEVSKEEDGRGCGARCEAGTTDSTLEGDEGSEG